MLSQLTSLLGLGPMTKTMNPEKGENGTTDFAGIYADIDPESQWREAERGAPAPDAVENVDPVEEGLVSGIEIEAEDGLGPETSGKAGFHAEAGLDPDVHKVLAPIANAGPDAGSGSRKMAESKEDPQSERSISFPWPSSEQPLFGASKRDFVQADRYGPPERPGSGKGSDKDHAVSLQGRAGDPTPPVESVHSEVSRQFAPRIADELRQPGSGRLHQRSEPERISPTPTLQRKTGLSGPIPDATIRSSGQEIAVPTSASVPSSPMAPGGAKAGVAPIKNEAAVPSAYPVAAGLADQGVSARSLPVPSPDRDPRVGQVPYDMSEYQAVRSLPAEGHASGAGPVRVGPEEARLPSAVDQEKGRQPGSAVAAPGGRSGGMSGKDIPVFRLAGATLGRPPGTSGAAFLDPEAGKRPEQQVSPGVFTESVEQRNAFGVRQPGAEIEVHQSDRLPAQQHDDVAQAHLRMAGSGRSASADGVVPSPIEGLNSPARPPVGKGLVADRTTELQATELTRAEMTLMTDLPAKRTPDVERNPANPQYSARNDSGVPPKTASTGLHAGRMVQHAQPNADVLRGEDHGAKGTVFRQAEGRPEYSAMPGLAHADLPKTVIPSPDSLESNQARARNQQPALVGQTAASVVEAGIHGPDVTRSLPPDPVSQWIGPARPEVQGRALGRPGSEVRQKELSPAAVEADVRMLQGGQRTRNAGALPFGSVSGAQGPVSGRVTSAVLADLEDDQVPLEFHASARSTDPRVMAAPTQPAPTYQRVDAHPILRQVAEAVTRMSDDSVEIRLSPEELGTVRLQMVHGGNSMTVHITADRPETLDLMRRNIEDLARDLAEAGYEGAEFTFGEGGDGGRGDGRRHSQDRNDPVPVNPTPGTMTPKEPATSGLDLRI